MVMTMLDGDGKAHNPRDDGCTSLLRTHPSYIYKHPQIYTRTHTNIHAHTAPSRLTDGFSLGSRATIAA